MKNADAYEVLKRFSSINAYGALCQTNWETRTGGRAWNSELFLRSNNAAGIKAGSGWKGAVYEKVSWEQMPDGSKRDIKSAFRRYSSFEEFAMDYAAKISANYPESAARTDNLWGYIAGLQHGKYGAWATDRDYIRKLFGVAIELAPDVFGGMWRNKLLDAFDYATEKDYLTAEEAKLLHSMLNTKLIAGTPSTTNTAPSVSAPKKIVCIDAGHGGKDPGAIGGGVEEKKITLIVAKLVGSALKDAATVVFTRSDDRYLSLGERCSVANKAKADLFISLHCNSATDATANGIEIFTHTVQSKTSIKAAGAIYGKALPVSGLRNRGIKNANFAVLRETKMPAVLMEMGFISNADNRSRLVSVEWQQKLAKAIANGILEALS